MNVTNKEHLKKPFESFDGKGYAPKEFFEPWVKTIEDILKDFRTNDIADDEILPVFLDVFEQYNYKQLSKDLLQTFVETENTDYYWLFKRLFDATKLDCNCGNLEEYCFDILHSTFFNEDESNAVVNILKKEVTPTLEFNGSTISIEEFMSLSKKVSETNKHLSISLLFNDVVKKAVAKGLTTLEDTFAIKVKGYKENARSNKNDAVN